MWIACFSCAAKAFYSLKKFESIHSLNVGGHRVFKMYYNINGITDQQLMTLKVVVDGVTCQVTICFILYHL